MKPALPLLSLTVAACSSAPSCVTTVRERTFDPRSDRYASTAVRKCGKTKDWATVVQVGRTGESPGAAVEVFVADTNHGQAINGAEGSIWIDVGWTAPGQLSLSYASQAHIIKAMPWAKQTKMQYYPTDPIEPELVY